MTPDQAGPDQPTVRTSDGSAGDDGRDRLVGGRYRLVRSIGRGGMGVVWHAHDETLDREIAVKEVTLPPGLDDHQRTQLRERTLREARAAARIRSEAAVTVYDVVEEDGRPWIVMELLPARSLADVVREEGPLPADRAAATGLRVLDALSAAHAAGVLHRDVKPANVLFDASGQAVLTDFGIASLEGDPSMTTTGTVVGSPGYVAPERALGRPPSAASDLWSLGVTLAAAVHGRSPFEKDTPLATIVSAMQDPVPETVATGPLGGVIGRLLAKDPAERPDADETRRLLRAAATDPGAGRTAVLPTTGPRAGAAGAGAGAGAGAAVGAGAAMAAGAAVGAGTAAQRTQALPRVPAGGPRPPAASSVRAPGRPPYGGPATGRPATGRAPAVPDERRSWLIPVLLAVIGLVAAGLVVAIVLETRDPATTATGSTSTAPTAAPTAPEQAPAAPAPAGTPAAPTPAPDDGQAEDGDEGDDQGEGDGEDGGNGNGNGRDEGRGAEAGVQPGQAPQGFQLYEDPAYAVAVPAGWTAEVESETRTIFSDPSSRRYLLVEEGGEPAGDPVEDWERQEQSVSQRLAGYELLGIERADYRDFDAADWQFRWDAEDGRLRVLNRAVVDTDLDQAYALYWSVPDGEWDASRPVFDTIAASFQPR